MYKRQLVTSAYCLYVNDVRIGATPYEGALEELLDQLQKAASDEDTISCEFAEDVEIRQEYVPTSEIMNLGYIAELLYSKMCIRDRDHPEPPL